MANEAVLQELRQRFPDLPSWFRGNYVATVGSPEYNWLLQKNGEPSTTQPQGVDVSLGASTPNGDFINGKSPNGTGGPYDAFNAAFKKALGRDITQAEQSDNAFVSQLSNELFRLLPLDRQVGFSSERLGKLAGTDLQKVVEFQPAVAAAFPTSFWKSFDNEWLSRVVGPYFKANNPGEWDNIVAQNKIGGAGAPGSTPPPGTTPPPGAAPITSGPTPGYVFDPKPGIGTAQELLGGFKGLDLPELDLERLFPFITDPSSAAANLMEAAGITAGKGNPFASFLEGELPQLTNIARVRGILGGGEGQVADIAKETPNILGGGITRSTGQGLIGDLAKLARGYRAAPEKQTTTQSAYASGFLDDPEKALSTLSGFQNVAPDLRRSQARANQDILRRFRNRAGGTPNATIWDFLGL